MILVVDAAAQGRSVAALVHGFRSFGTVRLAGVILNRVGSDRHEQILRDACEEVGTPVLGALRRADAVAAPSRHLGLVPAAERRAEAQASVDALATLVAAAVDLDEVAAIARSAPPLAATPWSPLADDPVPGRPVVALAGGPAFSFSYAETAELLAGAGAEVVTVDPLRDEKLPDGTRALVVGGGFPEVFAAELSANEPLRIAVASLAAVGAPIAAECAGLLWLCRTLDDAPMCGVLDADAAHDAVADPGLSGRGGAQRQPARAGRDPGDRPRVPPHDGAPAVGGAAVAGGRGGLAVAGADPEGFATPGVHASYLHLHWAADPALARRLVATAARVIMPGYVTTHPRALGGVSPGGRHFAGRPDQRGIHAVAEKRVFPRVTVAIADRVPA